jgi:cobalamin synthase
MNAPATVKTSMRGKVFWHYAACVLILTASLKLLSIFMTPPGHSRPDVIISFLTNRELMILSALVEYLVAGTLLFSGDRRISCFALFYFTACASIYQAALLSLGGLPCNCLGAVVELVGLGADVSKLITWGILASLWIGIVHYGLDYWRRLRKN